MAVTKGNGFPSRVQPAHLCFVSIPRSIPLRVAYPPPMVREDRAEGVLPQIDFNRLFFGDFHKDYERDEKWAADFQRAYLAKRCDPEDDYIGVRQREEEREKKGLPPRVVFSQDWDMRDEQRYDETERRKKAAKKRRKNVPKRNPKRNQRPGDLTPGTETNAPRGTET
jgi:hypothetical protein